MKKTVRQILSAVLVFGMLLALVSCGNSEKQTKDPQQTESKSTATTTTTQPTVKAQVPNTVKEFDKCSWAEFAAILNSGHNVGNAWYINDDRWFTTGALKTIKLSNGEEIEIRILDFDHDVKPDGTKTKATLGVTALYFGNEKMNAAKTNAGNWTDSDMRKYLNDETSGIYSMLPNDLKQLITPVVKKTESENNAEEFVSSTDKLFLFSKMEMNGSVWNDVFGDTGYQYAYFFWRNVAAKTKQDEYGSWWLRSPDPDNKEKFYCIDETGEMRTAEADTAKGIVFGFCV